MKKLKLTAGIIIMLMISSTMVFSQTSKSATNQSDKTVKAASATVVQPVADKNHAATCNKHQNGQMQGKNFVDKNNDGICDNCKNKKENCTEATCKANQANCKGSESCPKGQKSGCAKSCGAKH